MRASSGTDAPPAFRGLVYSVFEDLPLDEFGNRIPPITAEIAWAGAPQAVVKDTTFLPGAAWFTGSAVLDPERGVLYFKTSAGAAQRYIRLAQTHRTARTWQLNAGAAATSALEQVRCLALEPGNAPRPPLSRSPDAEQSFRGLGYTMIALSVVGRGDWILRPAPLSQVPASRPRSPGAAIATSPELLDKQ